MQPPEFVVRNRKPDGSRFTLDEAVEFRRAFFATFPGLAAWIEEAWEMVRMGDVNEGRTPWGRRRLICPLIPGTRNNLAWRTFQSQINFKVQGACADGLKRSIVDIDSKLPPGAELILPVHDELLTLCREPDSGKVLAMVKDAVGSAYFFAWGGHLKLPIAFKPNIIKNWSEKK